MTVSVTSPLQNVTPGLVCAHHHLYSALARGMPAPPETPTSFLGVLEQIWWRLDTALDLEMIRASARLGALEALECGTTALIDHHESPNAIEGSLDVIAEATWPLLDLFLQTEAVRGFVPDEGGGQPGAFGGTQGGGELHLAAHGRALPREQEVERVVGRTSPRVGRPRPS